MKNSKSERNRAYKNQRRQYPSRKFVMLSTAFLESDVHRVLSDEGFRLLMLLLARKGKPIKGRENEPPEVGLTWAQIQERTGWNERKIRRAGDELVALKLVEKLLRPAKRAPQIWRLHTDTYNWDRFDEMLEKGKVKPTKNGRRSMRRHYKIDHRTGLFKGSTRS